MGSNKLDLVRLEVMKKGLQLQTEGGRMFKFITLVTFSLWSLALGQARTKTAVKGAKAPVAPVAPVKSSQASAKAVAPSVVRVVRPSISAKAEDVSNKIPTAFVEKMLSEGIWIDEVEKSGTPANMEMQALIAALISGMSSNSIADQIIKNDETYKLKIQLIRYFETARSAELAPYKLNPRRISEIKHYITQKYLSAVFSAIHSSVVKEYDPIMDELRNRLEKRLLSVVDLTPEIRRDWNAEKSQIKVHQYENFGLEEKKDGQYLVNGLYIGNKNTFAIDLSRSKEENLVTIAHEIVHAADPELIQQREKLSELYSVVIEKLKPHLSVADSAAFVKALIQDSFYEMNRFDFIASMQGLRDKRVGQLKLSLEKMPLEKLTHDPDFKNFMRSLIAVTIENEYKAYTLSYALYQNLKNNRIIPPLLSRNQFMQTQFKHDHSLSFTLSVAMNPFSKNTYMEALEIQNSPELTKTVNQIKSIFEINYLEQSKVMITEVGKKYAHLVEIIRSRNEAEDGEKMPSWTRPGNFNSPTNPFQVLEAKVSVAWTIRFKLNLEAFSKKIVQMQETLLGMRAGMMDLHEVTFGELKLLGMQPEKISYNGQLVQNRGQLLPGRLEPACKEDFLNQILGDNNNSQIEEYLSYFAELRWSPEARSDFSAIDQSEVMRNLYRFNLLKAVRWLRLELPQSQENIVGIKTMIGKLHTGQYDRNEITPEKAREMGDDLKKYLVNASVSNDELKKVEALMTAISQMYYMAVEDKWQTVSEEFYKRIMGARRFLENMGFQSKLSFPEIEKQMKQDVEDFRTQVRNVFAACGTPASNPIDFYSKNTPSTTFRLGRGSTLKPFPVTAICYNYELYVFRQSCDFNASASTTVPNGRPESKIFIGGRPIRLEPFLSYRK